MELVEDDAVTGKANLEKLAAPYDRVLYIGISVGLWAPYVAGQLDVANNNKDKYLPVVIGFNPPHLARDAPIKDFDKTFRSIVLDMEKNGEMLITPVIMVRTLDFSNIY